MQEEKPSSSGNDGQGGRQDRQLEDRLSRDAFMSRSRSKEVLPIPTDVVLAWPHVHACVCICVSV